MNKIVLNDRLVTIIRLTLILLFLLTSIRLNVNSFVCFLLLLGILLNHIVKAITIMTKSNEAACLKKLLILNNDYLSTLSKDSEEKSINIRFLNTPKNEKRPFLLISDTYLLELVKYDNRDSYSVFIDNYVQNDCDLYMANQFDLRYFLVSYCYSQSSQQDFVNLNEILSKLSENEDDKALRNLINNYLKTTKLDELFDFQDNHLNMVKFNLNKTIEWFSAKFNKLIAYLDQSKKSNDEMNNKITAFDFISQYLDVNLSILLRKELNLNCSDDESISLYTLEKKSNTNQQDFDDNPFKKKKRELSNIPIELLKKAKNDLFNHFLTDYSIADSLNEFQVIKNNTECIFARKSNLWGAPKWNDSLNDEDNISNFIPSFILFCNLCEPLHLDGYVIELPGSLFGSDLELFSDADPDQSKSMNSKYIHSKNWVFEFCKRTFFITTFSPCYSQTHSRYSFESSNSYILFQPELSFARRNLEPFTVETNWNNPKTIRDKIRVAYKKAGRKYLVQDHPISYEIIKPINSEGTNVIEWWKHAS